MKRAIVRDYTVDRDRDEARDAYHRGEPVAVDMIDAFRGEPDRYGERPLLDTMVAAEERLNRAQRPGVRLPWKAF